MLRNKKGQSLIQAGIGVLVLSIVVIAVAIPVVSDAMVTETDAVTNDTFSPASLPAEITVSTVEDGLAEDSETVTWVNGTNTSETAELTKDTDYEVLSYEDGKFNITSYADYSEADGDYFAFDYDYKPNGYIESGTTRMIVGYLPLALALALFMGALAVVRM